MLHLRIHATLGIWWGMRYLFDYLSDILTAQFNIDSSHFPGLLILHCPIKMNYPSTRLSPLILKYLFHLPVCNVLPLLSMTYPQLFFFFYPLRHTWQFMHYLATSPFIFPCPSHLNDEPTFQFLYISSLFYLPCFAPPSPSNSLSW